jgi:hypothetical protein
MLNFSIFSMNCIISQRAGTALFSTPFQAYERVQISVVFHEFRRIGIRRMPQLAPRQVHHANGKYQFALDTASSNESDFK